jgi:hypothetical protein
MLRIQHSANNRLTDGGKVVSFMYRPSSTPRKMFRCWYLFLLDAEQTPRPSAAERIKEIYIKGRGFETR